MVSVPDYPNHEEMYRHILPLVDDKMAKVYTHCAMLEVREEGSHIRYIFPSFWVINDVKRWMNRHREMVMHFTPIDLRLELVGIAFDRNVSDILDLGFYKELMCPACGIELHVCNVLTANTTLSLGNLGE